MASFDDFILPVRLFLKAYPWRRIDPIPWAPLKKPLSDCKLALVTSAAFTTPDQIPFDESIKGGDPSYRVLPDDVELKFLQEHHRSESFDHRGIHQDPNLAFPRDRIHELARNGIIGSVNHRHLSFMGSIIATGRLRTQTAPEAASLLKHDSIDLALVVPV